MRDQKVQESSHARQPDRQNSFAEPFTGIIPPLVTPLLDRDTLDVEGTQRLLDHVLHGGVSGVFVLGTTGEAPSLGYRLRREFIELVCRHVDGRVPVLVGITDTAFVESIAIAETARSAGANAVVLSTPYYFPAGQTELTRYVEHIAEQVALPIVLYNIPILTKVSFDIATLRRLADLPQIVGVKDSSGDLDYFRELSGVREQRPDWTIMIGPENLLPQAMHLGAHGGVCGGANIVPKLFVDLYQSLTNGNSDQAARLQQQVEKLQEIYSVGKYASRFIKATKSALSLRGICSDRPAEPFNHFLEPERSRVNAILDQLEY